MSYLKRCLAVVILLLPVFLFSQGSRSTLKLIPFNDSGKWGFSDTLANIVIEGKYDSVGLFNTIPKSIVYATMYRKGKVGLILEDGTELLPTKFDRISREDVKSNWYFRVIRKNKHTLYDLKGEEIISKSTSIFNTYSSGPLFAVEQKGKFRLFNFKSKKYLDQRYTNMSTTRILEFRPKMGRSYLANSLAVKKENGGLEVFQADTTYSFSKEIVDSLFHQVALKKAEVKSKRKPPEIKLPPALSLLQDQYGMDSVSLKKSIKHVPTHKYTYVYGFKDGREVIMDVVKNEKVDLGVDEILEIHDYWYSAGEIYAQDSSLRVLFTVKDAGKMGVLRRDGKVILPVLYDNLVIERHFMKRYLFLEKDGKYGLKMMCCDGIDTVEPYYDSIVKPAFVWLGKNRPTLIFMVSKGGNYGYLGYEGIKYFNWK